MKVNVNKKIIITILVMSIMILLLIGYFTLQGILNNDSMGIQDKIPPNQNRIATDITHLDLTFLPVSDDDKNKGELVLGVYEAKSYGIIHLETPQDLITIQMSNTTLDELNLLLKVFYNYEEIPFQILGADKPNTEFLFTLEGNYQIDIPIQLSEELHVNETISRLTVGVFIAPEYFVGNNDDFSENLRAVSGLTLNYEINYGSNDELILPTPAFEITTESEFGGFAIHSNKEPPGDGSLWFFPNSLVVTRGEEVDLTFFANVQNTEDYVIVSMLDWVQIPMNDQPFLWVKPQNNAFNVGQYASFTITAPDEPGFYEFLSFLVPNPIDSTSFETFAPLEMVRFTIEVVE